MDQKNKIMNEYKAKFNAVYSNLPLSVRDDVVIVLDGEPLSWNVAWIEINSASDKTEQILKDLAELEIIL